MTTAIRGGVMGCLTCVVCCTCAKRAAMSDAERYVIARVRDAEPLTHMHRRALWQLAERGIEVCLPSQSN